MSNEPSLDDLKEGASHLPEKEQAMRQANEHVHGPFTFLINERNVLRACQVCGATWIGFIGDYQFPIKATWRYVGEPEPEENE